MTGQVFLGVPAHVVHEPVDLGCELHVARDVHRRLVAAQCRLRQLQRRVLGERQREFGRQPGRGRELEEPLGAEVSMETTSEPEAAPVLPAGSVAVAVRV